VKIIEVSLDGMGCFCGGKTFSFDANRVVVLGRNEAGKSTLMRSISALIYGFPKHDEEEHWRPWGHCGSYGGSIQFEIDKDRYRLNRKWGGDQVQLMRNDDIIFDDDVNPRGKTGETFQAVLADILPISRPEFFHMLSFIRQEELSATITEDLRQRITGSGRRDAMQVLEYLHAKYAELTWEKPPWGAKRLVKPRKIEEIEHHLEDKRQRRKRATEAAQQGGQIETELHHIETAIAEKAKEAGTTKSLLQKYEELSQWLTKEHDTQQGVARLGEERERVEKLDTEAQSLTSNIQAQYAGFADMPSYSEELILSVMSHEQQLDDISSRLSTIENQLNKLGSAGKLPWHRLAIPLILGVVSGGAIGMALGNWALGGIIGVLLGVVVVIGWHIVARTAYSREHGTLGHDKTELQKQIVNIENELVPLRTQLAPLLKNYDPAEALTKWRSFQDRNRELRDAKKGVEANRDLATIKKEHETTQLNYQRILDNIDKLVKEHSYLAPVRNDPGKLGLEVERRRQEQEQLDADLQALKDKQQALRLQWERQVGGGVEDLETLNSEIQALEKQLADYRRQTKALLLAAECLSEAIDNIRDEHRGGIQSRLNQLFQTWTGNLKRLVNLDDQWNPIVEYRPDRTVELDSLSRGTLDQLYLAYRVALSEALSQEVAIPFLLDDPFVHFDPERRKLARQAFEAISERHQVILFTQDPWFKEWGKLVEL
jgi:DNA repair exonuclease SbcCD ATPase subunit